MDHYIQSTKYSCHFLDLGAEAWKMEEPRSRTGSARADDKGKAILAEVPDTSKLNPTTTCQIWRPQNGSTGKALQLLMAKTEM